VANHEQKVRDCINRLERSRLCLKQYIRARLALDNCRSDRKRQALTEAVLAAECRLIGIGDWPQTKRELRAANVAEEAN